MESRFKSKTLLALAGLALVCLVVQLLPIISVPITSPSRHLYLANYGNYTFGVLGVCRAGTTVCSNPRIGYPSTNSTFYDLFEINDYATGRIELPSRATYTISKLLVMHIVAFCLSGMLLLSIFGLMFVGKLKTATIYYTFMLVFSLLSFVCTLLAFLADLLLFVPNLSYLGWIQLIPTVFLTIIAVSLCFVKRTITSRKYIEENPRHIDDMRIHRIDKTQWTDGDASDDGFYVYTNGFYSTGDQRIQRNESQSHRGSS